MDFVQRFDQLNLEMADDSAIAIEFPTQSSGTDGIARRSLEAAGPSSLTWGSMKDTCGSLMGEDSERNITALPPVSGTDSVGQWGPTSYGSGGGPPRSSSVKFQLPSGLPRAGGRPAEAGGGAGDEIRSQLSIGGSSSVAMSGFRPPSVSAGSASGRARGGGGDRADPAPGGDADLDVRPWTPLNGSLQEGGSTGVTVMRLGSFRSVLGASGLRFDVGE